MQKHIKQLLKDNRLVIAISITIAILLLSLVNTNNTGIHIHINHIDKVFHATAYCCLTLCWLIAFYKLPQKKHTIFASCVVFGIIIELLQYSLTVYRTGDYVDVFANTFGAFVGLQVFNFFLKKKQHI